MASNTPPEENANRKHIRKVQTEIRIEVNKAIDQVFKSATGLKMVNNRFTINDHPRFAKKLAEALKKFRVNVEGILLNGISDSFDLSQQNFVRYVYNAYDGRALVEPVKAMLARKYDRVLDAFLNRTVGGMGLSDRIWQLSYQFQREIEWTIFAGLSEGQSAQTMARSLKRSLRNPDALFRRVRNKEGKLVLSKAAKKFKPGQGVYRSSYKNAMRVSRTEINAAYRTADHEQFKSIPFVLGIEIRLSDAHVVYDICDVVAGVYPSWFKFTMWHIQCICYSIPILADREQFDQYQKAVLNGTEDQFEFKGVITEPPKQFYQWIRENKQRVNEWAHLPPFLKDNPRFKKLLE